MKGRGKMKEMVGGCCVCADERGWPENPLVYCDGQGCTVAVHQACYGIQHVPSGPWFCRKCESQERAARVKCELCPSKGGALKRTDNGCWAHIVCALYIPEVRFGNVTTMEPIVLQMVPPDRYSRKCCICEDNGKESKAATGACMQCNKPACKNYFHVTCAQASGLLCEEQGDVELSENVKYCGYCSYHYNKLKRDERSFSNIKPIPAFRPVRTVDATPESSPEKPSSSFNSSNHSSSSSLHKKFEPINNSSDNKPTKKKPSSSKSSSSSSLLSPANRTHSLSPKVSLWDSVKSSSHSEKPLKPKPKTEPENNPKEKQNREMPSSKNSVLSNGKKRRRKLSSSSSDSDSSSSSSHSSSSSSSSPGTSSKESSPILKRTLSASRQDKPRHLEEIKKMKEKPRNPPTEIKSPVPEEVVKKAISSSKVKEKPFLSSETETKKEKINKTFSGSSERSVNGNERNVPVTIEKNAVKKVKKRKSEDASSPPLTLSSSSTTAHMEKSKHLEEFTRKAREKPKTIPIERKAVLSEEAIIKKPKKAIVTKEKEKVSPPLDVETKKEKPHKPNGGSSERSVSGSERSISVSLEKSAAKKVEATRCNEIDRPPPPPPSLTTITPPEISMVHSLQECRLELPSPVRQRPAPVQNEDVRPAEPPPHSLEELLERQWAQGTQFVMNQAQHFDIASLLSCLSQLRQENERLEERCRSLVSRREHLVAVNARLSLPLNGSLAAALQSAPPAPPAAFNARLPFLMNGSSGPSSHHQNMPTIGPPVSAAMSTPRMPLVHNGSSSSMAALQSFSVASSLPFMAPGSMTGWPGQLNGPVPTSSANPSPNDM
ncbi:Protein AF-10 [Halotydeus destructor]|nr:Protein AF-10 [Halotydeus destructor]